MKGLRIANLSAGYPRRLVVRGLSLPAFEPGEVVSLVGPNGAGKSTLLRALAGLAPAGGSARLDGTELIGLPLAERSRRVTYMPQTLPQGAALTVLETVVTALKASPLASGAISESAAAKRAVEMLDRVGAADLALQRLDRLSGGQRQLAGLAQALARDPRLLLLDEPTSALDLNFQMRVLALARRFAAETGAVLIIVLHDLQAAARVSDRVVVLSHGEAAAVGTPEASITPQVLAEVYKVRARVESCGRGQLQVMVDDVL